jgi:hypothetical protein
MQLDFRGLEKQASSLFEDRREYIKADVAAVVFDSKFIVARVLSSQYQDCSRASRAFARIIGETDYLAVARACSQENERREPIESIKPATQRTQTRILAPKSITLCPLPPAILTGAIAA